MHNMHDNPWAALDPLVTLAFVALSLSLSLSLSLCRAFSCLVGLLDPSNDHISVACLGPLTSHANTHRPCHAEGRTFAAVIHWLGDLYKGGSAPLWLFALHTFASSSIFSYSSDLLAPHSIDRTSPGPQKRKRTKKHCTSTYHADPQERSWTTS